MKIKTFQLNIYTGKYLDKIIDFLNNNDFDIIQMQEVASNGFGYANKDCFEEIKNTNNYQGVFQPTLGLKTDNKKVTGCATFYKKNLNLIKKDILWLKPFSQIEKLDQFITADPPNLIENQGRGAICLKFKFEGKKINFINSHLAWSASPNDTPIKLEVGKKLFDYSKTISDPFVLTGDFNVNESSQIVKWFSSISKNLIDENGVNNTLNPRLHRAKHLFPKGLAVDFAFVSSSLKTKNFKLIENDLSDHFGFTFELDI